MSKNNDGLVNHSHYGNCFSSAWQIVLFQAILLLIIVSLAVLYFWLFGP